MNQQIIDELKTGKRHVSHSQIMKFADCKKKWWYYAVRRLRMNYIDSAVTKRTLGKLIHMGLENILRGRAGQSVLPAEEMYELWLSEVIDEFTTFDEDGNPSGGLLKEELDMLNNLIHQSMMIVAMTIKRIDKEFPPDVWETLKDKEGEPIIEYQIYSHLPNGVKVLSYIDWAIRNKETGQIFVADFKSTTKKKYSYDGDVQVSGLYVNALIENGIIDGFVDSIIIEINANELKKPKINQGGSISRAAIHTTWGLYSQTVIEQGQNPDDYLDVRRKLMGIEFVKIHRILRTEFEHKHIVANRSQMVDDIIRSLEINVFPAHLGYFLCGGCEFNQACKEDVAGYGHEALIDAGVYKISELEDNISDERNSEKQMEMVVRTEKQG